MYEKITNKIKSLYTHFWVFFDKNGQEIERCRCTAREKNESALSIMGSIGAKSFKKVRI